MFRKMRKINQQLSEEEVIEILKTGETGVLGVLGDGGYPYTVPVNYVYENGKIYLHGANDGYKNDAIKQCDKVSFCIIGKDEIDGGKLTTYYKSVILFGRARILESEEEIFHAAEVLGLKFNTNQEAVDKEIRNSWGALSCTEIVIEHMTGKAAIELICEKS